MANEGFELDSKELINNGNGLRAPEASEMLERPPSWLFRWGVLSILLTFGIFISIGLIVKYPDTLEGSGIITTDPLPIKLKSVTGGRITQLFSPDAAAVQKSAPIAEIENTTGYENIKQLQSTIDSVNVYLQTENDSAIDRIVDHPLTSLGDAQIFYNQLLQQLSARILVHKEHVYSKRTNNLQSQIGSLRSIAKISRQEEDMIGEEIKQSDERFTANEKLYAEKIISRQEYYDEAARLRQKKMQLEQQKRNSIQDNISSGENNKQMLEIKYDQEEKERTLMVGVQEALRNISNFMQTWQLRYLIIAPYAGTIQYLRPLQVNEPTDPGEDLFAIIPDQHKYMALVMLASAGIGKVKVGQNVHLLLDNFPYNEFGFLEGKIIRRSMLPETPKNNNSIQQTQQSMYRVYVQLPDTLITSYGKKILFNPEMTATARIITKDRNLLQRLMSGIGKIDR